MGRCRPTGQNGFLMFLPAAVATADPAGPDPARVAATTLRSSIMASTFDDPTRSAGMRPQENRPARRDPEGTARFRGTLDAGRSAGRHSRP